MHTFPLSTTNQTLKNAQPILSQDFPTVGAAVGVDTRMQKIETLIFFNNNFRVYFWRMQYRSCT